MIIYDSFSIGQCLSEVICPCQDICLSYNVIYTCTGIGSNLITWTVPNLMGGTEQLQILQHILHDTYDTYAHTQNILINRYDLESLSTARTNAF